MVNKTTIVIFDEKGVNEHDELLNKPTVMKEKDDDLEAKEDPPDWLPDGWIMEIYRTNDESLNRVSLIPYMHESRASTRDVIEPTGPRLR
jgi:hypothetical protein